MTKPVELIPAGVGAISRQAEAWRDTLIAWSEINSGSANLAGLDRMGRVLRDAFAPLADHCELAPVGDGRRCAVLAHRRRSAPLRVLLSGHYDTVYAPDHPFQACTRLDPDRLRGPGVADMKGGLVVMLAALRAFEASPAAENLGWELVIGPDEEIGSAATRPRLEEAARGCRIGLVFEPARQNGDLVGSRKALGSFQIAAQGLAAHAADLSAPGRNAISALMDFLLLARAWPEERPGMLFNIGFIRGGGAANVVPDFAEATIDVRVDRAGDVGWVRDRLESAQAAIAARSGCRFAINGGFSRPPMEENPATDRLFSAWRHAALDLGLTPPAKVHSGGGSDANLIAATGVPCLDGLGVVGGRLHSADEFVHLPSLVERAQLTALGLHRLAAGEIVLD